MASIHKHEVVQRLRNIGIAADDAVALRRISMTLRRWFELECGIEHPSNRMWTLAVERDGDEPDSQPYMRAMGNDRNGQWFDSRHKCLDREASAKKRLAAIMGRYPGLGYYVQGDPRGASLYILRPGDVPEGASVDSCYSRGVAVYQ